jgi:tetratricopeptide (TPR) repeat protein
MESSAKQILTETDWKHLSFEGLRSKLDVLKIENEDQLIEVCRVGYEYIIKNDLEKGKEILDRVNTIDSDNYYVIWLNGLYYQTKGDHNNSLTYLYKARDIKPNYANSYSQIAISLFGLKRKEEALEYIDKALEINQDDPSFYQIKVQICCLMRKWEDVLTFCSKLQEMEPEKPASYFYKALHVLS